MRAKRRTFLAIPFLILAFPAFAISSGHIQGRILDENGKPLEGALVTVHGAEAVGTWPCRTNATGFYRIAGLDVARPLTLRVEAEGRPTLVRTGYRLRADQTLRLVFRLKPPGVFNTLVILDKTLPYGRMALSGVLEHLPPGVHLFEADDRLPATVRRLQRALESRPDGVVAIGSLAARLARETTFDIPVVYTLAQNPVKEHLIASNMCGVLSNGGFSHQLELLKQRAPHVERIGALFVPERHGGAIEGFRRAALAANLSVRVQPLHGDSAVQEPLASLLDSEIDAFIVLLDELFWESEVLEEIVSFSERNGIILLVPDSSMAKAGNAVSYAPGIEELGSYAGALLKHILSGRLSVAAVGTVYPPTRRLAVNGGGIAQAGLMDR
jgi:ABC-type uncharacterized transport system substrate-binding protein